MKLNTINHSLFLGALGVALSSTCHAAVTLTEYKFTGDNEAARIVPTTVDSSVTASNWVLHPAGSSLPDTNLVGTSTNGTANEAGDPANSGSIFVRSSAGTPNNLDPTSSTSYMGFSFTVAALGVGEVLNITQFDYSIFATNANFNYSVGLFSDLTGFGAGDMISDANPRTTQALDNASDDLSDEAALQGLTSGQVVNFRIYFADNVNNNSLIPRLDNITISGDVVSIPEPSSAILLGLGGLALSLRRRK